MLTLVISWIFSTIIWSAVFFFLRKIQPTKTNGSRHLFLQHTYAGKTTASVRIILPIFSFLIALVFVVFFASPQMASWPARLGGVTFVLICFLSYLFLLRAIMEGRKS